LNVIETLKKENKKAYLHTLPFQVWVGQQQAKIFLSLALYYVNKNERVVAAKFKIKTTTFRACPKR
jgi:hypothetical protein